MRKRLKAMTWRALRRRLSLLWRVAFGPENMSYSLRWTNGGRFKGGPATCETGPVKIYLDARRIWMTSADGSAWCLSPHETIELMVCASQPVPAIGVFLWRPIDVEKATQAVRSIPPDAADMIRSEEQRYLRLLAGAPRIVRKVLRDRQPTDEDLAMLHDRHGIPPEVTVRIATGEIVEPFDVSGKGGSR